jgi:hypothetical protein
MLVLQARLCQGTHFHGQRPIAAASVTLPKPERFSSAFVTKSQQEDVPDKGRLLQPSAGQTGRPQHEVVVGIDLGTTNSAVAYIESRSGGGKRKGQSLKPGSAKPRCIPSSDDPSGATFTTPSVVAFRSAGEVHVAAAGIKLQLSLLKS